MGEYFFLLKYNLRFFLRQIRVCGLCWQASFQDPQDKDFKKANKVVAKRPAKLRRFLEQSSDGRLNLSFHRPAGPDVGPINCQVEVGPPAGAAPECEGCQCLRLRAEAALEGERYSRDLLDTMRTQLAEWKSGYLRMKVALTITLGALRSSRSAMKKEKEELMR